MSRSVAAVLTILLAAGAAGGATDGTWSYDGDGNWSDPAKWQSGLVADGTDQTAYFTFDISDGTRVNLDSDRTIGHLVFSDPGGTPYWWQLLSSGPALTLQTTAGVPTITTTTAYAGIGAPISGNQGFQKLGSGDLALAGDSTYTGVTTVSEGSLEAFSANALGATGSGNHTVVADGASVVANDTTNEDFIITGSGDGLGALRMGADNEAFAGHITLNGDATIGAGKSRAPSITGDISLPGSAMLTLRTDSGEEWAVHGTISGTGGLVVGYDGTDLYAANTFSGDTVVDHRLGLMNNNAVQNSTVQMNQPDLSFGSTILTPNFGGLAGAADLDLDPWGSPARALTVGGNDQDTTYSGRLQGDGSSLTKIGDGTLTLTGDNTYSGGTMVNDGTLVAGHNNALGTGLVNINGGRLEVAQGFTIANGLSFTGLGSTLGGSGTYQGNVTMGPGTILAPGSSPGLLTIDGDYTMDLLSLMSIQLGGTVRGDEYDALVVTGTMDLSGGLLVTLWDGFEPMAGNSFDLLDWGTLHGTFALTLLPPLTPGLFWDDSALYTTGTLSVSGSVQAVPVPGAAVLVLFGLATASGRLRRYRAL